MFTENYTQRLPGQLSNSRVKIACISFMVAGPKSGNMKRKSNQAARPISISPLKCLAACARLTYQPGGLPGVFRELALRETISWEELGT